MIFLTVIGCISVAKLTLKHPLRYPTDMKPLEAYFIRLLTVIVATMLSGIVNTFANLYMYVDC